MPFVKRTDVLINGFKYYDTITQKQETIEYYNYYNHLKRFGFTWEHSPLEFKYEITLSSDEKKMKKNITMDKITRRKLAIDESRILLVTRNNRLVSVSSEYVNNIIQYFKVCESEIKDCATEEMRKFAQIEIRQVRKEKNLDGIINKTQQI